MNIYSYLTKSQIDGFKPTFLYIKKHNITGKLYFGQTRKTGKQFESYTGSGSYWVNHINKHGKEHIKTLWFCLYYDIETLVEAAISLSKIMNIVESENWANQILETGVGAYVNGRKHTEYTKKLLSEARKNTTVYIDNTGEKHSMNINDDKVLSGEFVGHTKGYITGIDTTTGKTSSIIAEDFYNENKYVGINKNKTLMIYNNGVIKLLEKNHPDIISGLCKSVNIGKSTYVHDGKIVQLSIDDPKIKLLDLKNSNCGFGTYKNALGVHVRLPTNHPDVINGAVLGVNTKMGRYRDEHGNCISLPIDHPDVISKKYVGHTAGLSSYTNIISGEKKMLSKNDNLVLNGNFISTQAYNKKNNSEI